MQGAWVQEGANAQMHAEHFILKSAMFLAWAAMLCIRIDHGDKTLTRSFQDGCANTTGITATFTDSEAKGQPIYSKNITTPQKTCTWSQGQQAPIPSSAHR